jgi:hypothetical protein
MAQPSDERSIEELFGNSNMQLGGPVAPWPEDRGYQALPGRRSRFVAGPSAVRRRGCSMSVPGPYSVSNFSARGPSRNRPNEMVVRLASRGSWATRV